MRLGRQAVLGVPEPSIWADAARAHSGQLRQGAVNGKGCVPGTKVYASVPEGVQIFPKLANCRNRRNSSAVAAARVHDAIKGLDVRENFKNVSPPVMGLLENMSLGQPDTGQAQRSTHPTLHPITAGIALLVPRCVFQG